MAKLNEKNIIKKILKQIPIILLFISVLNNFDFNYLNLKYFSFNFSYILIFYFTLKRNSSLRYSFIFIAGLFNDVVNGTPIGMSSLIFLLLCVVAAYLRAITLRVSLLKDCISFVLTILMINSLSFVILNLFFNYEVSYITQIINVVFTSLLYFIFSFLFNYIEGNFNVR
jgi:rod shape-determining protein MreD